MFILIYVYSICDNIRIRHINIVGLVSYIVYIYIFIYLIYHSYYKCFTFLYHIYIYIYLNIYHAQFITYHLSCKMNKQYIYIYIYFLDTHMCLQQYHTFHRFKTIVSNVGFLWKKPIENSKVDINASTFQPHRFHEYTTGLNTRESREVFFLKTALKNLGMIFLSGRRCSHKTIRYMLVQSF